MIVDVTYARPDRQLSLPVELNIGCSVKDAIVKSGIIDHFPEISLSQIKVGIFGKTCRLEKPLAEGDRVEIYRPLLITPMDARRHRAKSSH